MSSQCVILAGGMATRLAPLTDAMPKSLVAVEGRPFLDHQLMLLERNGIEDVVLCVGHLGDLIRERFGLRWHDIRLCYSAEREGGLKDTGGALRQALPFLRESFFLLYGDSFLDIAYDPIRAHFREHRCEALLVVFRNENRWGQSNALFDGARVTLYDKRHPRPEMAYIDYGLSLISRAIVEEIPPEVPADLAEVYRRLSQEGRLSGFEVTQRFYEIGTPAGIEDLQAHLRRQTRSER